MQLRLEDVAAVFGWWEIDEHNIRINLFNQLHQLPVAGNSIFLPLVQNSVPTQDLTDVSWPLGPGSELVSESCLDFSLDPA